MMEPVYARLRTRARQIVARFPAPVFYAKFPAAARQSREILATDPLVLEIKSLVADCIGQNFGHGLVHSIKVAEDAGTLVLIESGRHHFTAEKARRIAMVTQCAGLLHDIRRRRKHHAVEGAIYARKLLAGRPLSQAEIEAICLAIHNHEAFQPVTSADSVKSRLVSDCLYDADKFRWGPDNFTDTVWDMVACLNPPLETFIAHYPRGMDKIARIKKTFRSKTGKVYGPDFIDLGLAIGRELFHIIHTDFCD